VLHRDLKPANIMIDGDGNARILDFGLAGLSEELPESELAAGTPAYMAPEQLDGNEADARSDIFALGSVLYEMITGRRAFTGESQARLISAIMTSELPPIDVLQPDAPPALDHVVGRCLAKDPDERWQSALDVARELEWLSQSAPVKARRPAPRTSAAADFRVEYFRSPDGASIAGARGGRGTPLFVVPSMVDAIEISWAIYAEAFEGHELITYDRRGTGLSERGARSEVPEPYLQDAQTVVDGFRLQGYDVVGTLLGTIEAAWIASRNHDRVKHLVLRAPTLGLRDWASIPGVRAALAAMDQDWDYFTESFAQFVVGWGNPNARKMAERLRKITSRGELHSLLDAFKKFELAAVYPEIRVPTLVEHHPRYFFPDIYSRRIASMIPDCQMAVFSGADGDFMFDLRIAGAFLEGE
jgi:pimeloyl-ACP methyl ester carboxylesterase